MKTANTVAAAFLAGKRRSIGHARSHGTAISYRGNPIAIREGDGTVLISSAGWQTPTTKRYLNALGSLIGFRIHQQGGEWFLNGLPWDSPRDFINPATFTLQNEDEQ